ncbi:MAG: Na/Pi cotransporter family protein [Butyricicoccus sp.]
MNSEILTTLGGLLGGLAVFIYGMNLMSEGLQKAAGERMKQILGVLTKNRLIGVLAGALVTAVLQSSSATTVMVIGFVSAGLMSLPQAISVILGANIGTTLTAQIIAFKIDDYIWPIVFVGFLLYFFPKKEQLKNVGQTIFAFGLLFVGITTMSSVMKPLASSELFLNMIAYVSHVPVLGVLVGALMTLVVQSSSATIAVLQNFAAQPAADGVTSILGLTGAIPILLGDNIGTTITAILATVGQPRQAKRTALAHCTFNISGALLFIWIVPWYARFIQYISPKGNEVDVIARQIANAHTCFNVVMTLVWLPLLPILVKIVTTLIPIVEKKVQAQTEPKFLDNNVRHLPSAAINLTRCELVRIGEFAVNMSEVAREGFLRGADEKMERVYELEDVVDILQDKTIRYLSSLCTTGYLTDKQSATVSKLIRAASDFERIGDQLISIANFAKLKKEKGYTFTETAMEELRDTFDKVEQMLERTVQALNNRDQTMAASIIHQQEDIEGLERRLSQKHMERLQLGSCSPENTVAFTDVLHDLESIGEFCSDIAEILLDEDLIAELKNGQTPGEPASA